MVVESDCSTIVTDGVITVEIAREYEDREDFFKKNGDGVFCVKETDPPILKWINLTMTMCDVDPYLVNFVAALLKETGIVPSTLLLEITESTMMESADTMVPVLRQLREIGVRLAMDDFGTGHSSLGFLHSVPMDILKIDRSFIKTSTTKRDSAAISRTIVQLAQNLDMKVVAEGIETREQLSLFQRLKCPYGQGFLFGEPMAPEAAGRLLDRGYTFNLAA